MKTKTQIEVLSIISDILKQMEKVSAIGVECTYYIKDVELCDLFKLYENLKTTAKVRLEFIGEAFNPETIDIQYRVFDGFYIIISSVPQKELKPKINLINYN